MNKTKGGTLYEVPELSFILDSDGKRILPDGATLKPVDIEAMVAKNSELLQVVEQVTIKKIYEVYKRYRKKLDCFHVAFSGGKDSIVLLDLVKKALPKGDFMVVFGDTGMEFPDTYDVVDNVERECKANEIEFYRATANLKPEESWRLFGPPSRVLRWCCYVHKSAPQTLRLREILGKSDYVGMDFVGVRAHESMTRADYEYESYGKKQKGQYSHNPILEWTSAEVWLYIYAHALTINNAYKKGNARAGCLFCPMSGGKADSFRNLSYSSEIETYTDIIREMIEDEQIESYITGGGWIARKNGRDLVSNSPRYQEEVRDGSLIIKVRNATTDWSQWVKTVGDTPFTYTVEGRDGNLVVKVPLSADKTKHAKLLKQVFRKAAYCVGCRVCEVNCPTGAISFDRGLYIEGCIQCGRCHDIVHGCLMYHSRALPKNGGRPMKSLNTFADHAPKIEWVRSFFEKQNAFFANNTLGPSQISFFKRFLSDATLMDKGQVTEFAELIADLGWETEQAWGLILIELAYNNPQVRWYIEELEIGMAYPRKSVESMLTGLGISAKDASSVVKAFGRLSGLPLGTKLNFGVSRKGRAISSLTRAKSNLEDGRVLLYSLYKFAEACGGYYQFTLTRLLDHTVESEGLSPTRIFGCDRADMEQFLNGLSAKYPDFINATFTHDLDKITLREDKASADVLGLFSKPSH